MPTSSSRLVTRTARLLLGLVALLSVRPAAAAFTEFESGQVRPLALSPDGTRLFAVNTPDDQLEIFAVGAGGLTHTGSVPVGLEPVAVAARTNTEVWVVNHLSDSVTIVDLSSSPPRVTRTLLTCDEPRDIVFAGGRAFITTARRGQNCPVPANLTTAGTDRAVVQVWDPANLGATLGGTPAANVTLFGDTPRALATDGTSVWAAIFESGNQTTTLSEGVVCNGGAAAGPCQLFGTTGTANQVPGGLPAPNANLPQGITGPETGLIVKFNGTHWVDQLNRNWDNGVRFSLPDLDVFKLNATSLAQTASFASVGTVLFNMAVNPVSGKVYVSNTDANNAVRFEGPGGGGSTVRGHLAESRISVLSGSTVTPVRLNKHINYSVVPSPPGTAALSYATPTGMAVSSDGATLYVAAFGSAAVGVFTTAAIEANGATIPSVHVPLSAGGPSGLVLDEAHQKVYVLTRFDDGVSEVSTVTNAEVAHHAMHNPEPPSVLAGRPFLYDAVNTSSNGEAACASCHIFGDFDSLAWDLGNPDDFVLHNPNPIRLPGPNPDFHPLKGPMTTQSLRGMANHGPMHWRGDRTAGNDPGGDPLDERGAFKKFNVAFGGLLGRTGPITDSAMGAFADFILQVTYPPNPNRNLDNTLKNPAAPAPSEQRGHDFFFGPVSDVFANCDGCHVLNPALGFFGGDGQTTFENETQMFKVPHLRNAYQKVGMFGMAPIQFLTTSDNGNKGPQVRGFGFLHDGSVDTLFRFHGATVFSTSNQDKLDLEAFVLAFDSNLAPVVGQQITLTSTNAGVVGTRITLLEQRAAAGECDLTVKGTVAGIARGAVRMANGKFQFDRATDVQLTDAQVRALATTAGQEQTFLCVPPGSGLRVGVDRDEDGFFDRDEIDAGTNPADPLSFPGSGTTTTTTTVTTVTTTSIAGGTTTSTTLPQFVLIRTSALTLRDKTTPTSDPEKRKFSFRSATKMDPTANRVVFPLPGSSGDPTLAGATLQVYNAAGVAPDSVTVLLPASHWTLAGTPSKPRGFVYKDSTGSAGGVYAATVKNDTITIKARRSAWAYTLDEPSQVRVAVRLGLGLDPPWCAAAFAKSTPQNDHVDKFTGLPKTPAPPSCPPTP